MVEGGHRNRYAFEVSEKDMGHLEQLKIKIQGGSHAKQHLDIQCART